MHFWIGIRPIHIGNLHLKGEYNEMHKFRGWLQTGKSIQGWIDNNCVQVVNLDERYEKVKRELQRRNEKGLINYCPQASLGDYKEAVMEHYTQHLDFRIDKELNRRMLRDKYETNPDCNCFHRQEMIE